MSSNLGEALVKTSHGDKENDLLAILAYYTSMKCNWMIC